MSDKGAAMKMDDIGRNKIVALGPMRRKAHFRAMGRIEAYWEGLRDGRLMPTRSDVDPRGISDVIEYAFLLEKVAPGLARIRLAGRHLNELMTMEVRGMPLSALFLPDARHELKTVLENVLDEPSVVRLSLTSDRGFTRPALTAQMILLPLRDSSGVPARVLGALQSRGDVGQGPRRFRIHDVETKLLLGDPLTARRERGSDTVSTDLEPQSEAPHLRLVHDADAG